MICGNTVSGSGLAQKLSTGIDLSKFKSNGTIVETFADDTTKTYSMKFDSEGNPIKITDSDGNTTTLTW